MHYAPCNTLTSFEVPPLQGLTFIQRNIFRPGSPKEGQEDALTLNVYSHNLGGQQVGSKHFLARDLEIPGYIWIYLEISGYIWIYLEISGYIWI